MLYKLAAISGGGAALAVSKDLCKEKNKLKLILGFTSNRFPFSYK